MKTIIILSIFAFGILLLSGMIKTIKAETENQKYETLYKKNNFEVRFYPEAILATVKMDGTIDNSKNSGFRVLAGYIFGGNKEEEKIAMTSPVRMNSNQKQSSMSFVLPAEMDFNNLPQPLNDEIVLHQSNPVYTASIQYGGWTNDKEIKKMEAELVKILNELGLDYKTNFEYLGYNPPYQMVNRRNEVIVELDNFNIENFEKNLAEK